MYLLKEYYLNKNKLCEHIVTNSESIEYINKIKTYICEMLNECGVSSYEILSIKDINSLKNILKMDELKIFQVVKV